MGWRLVGLASPGIGVVGWEGPIGLTLVSLEQVRWLGRESRALAGSRSILRMQVAHH